MDLKCLLGDMDISSSVGVDQALLLINDKEVCKI